MADREQSIEEIMRAAGVAWEPGMRSCNGLACVLVRPYLHGWVLDGGGLYQWQPDRSQYRCLELDEHPGWRDMDSLCPLPDVPDLTDPATYALCLAQLARRLGLDPERGATFDGDGRIWSVQCAGGRAWTPDLPDCGIDHRRALALALRATAEGSNGQE